MATIHCADCGDERRGTPKNTRYCKRCRALRDLDHWRRLTRRCSCGATFAPLNRGDLYCAACDPGLRAYSGTCVLSPADAPHSGPFVNATLPVCAACARDPKQRKRLIRALEVGQAGRKKAAGR